MRLGARCVGLLILVGVVAVVLDRVSAATLNFQAGQETPVDPGTLGGVASVALGANDGGSLVGYSYPYVASNITRAFIWDSGSGMQDLGAPGTNLSFAMGINNLDEVVGYGQDPDATGPGFIWDSTNGMQTLPDLGGSLTIPVAISDLSDVVGYAHDASGNYHAFLWNATDGISDLGTLGGNESYALGINDYGFVVGTSQNGSGEYRAFLWTSRDGLIDLGFEGTASAINSSGEVTGIYTDPSNDTPGFMWNSLAFYSDFESGQPAEVTTNDWTLSIMESGTDGTYGDHGFSGTSFMTSRDKKGTDTLNLSLSGLDTHTSIDLSFLLAVINKIDAGTTLEIVVDGTTVFLETIAWDTSAWNPGAPIVMFSDLYLGYKTHVDSGYDKGMNMSQVGAADHSQAVDLSAITHSASTLTVQIISDNSSENNVFFAVDDLTVILNKAVPTIDLGSLGGTFGQGRSIDESGQIVGTATVADGTTRAFVWDSTNGIVDLNDYVTGGTDWVTLTEGWSINESGDIVGNGLVVDSTNRVRGFLLTNP